MLILFTAKLAHRNVKICYFFQNNVKKTSPCFLAGAFAGIFYYLLIFERYDPTLRYQTLLPIFLIFKTLNTRYIRIPQTVNMME